MSVTWATRGRTCWGSPSTTCCTPTACGSSSPSTGSVGRYKGTGKGDRRSMRNCVQRTLIRLHFPFKFCLNLTADPPPRPFQMCINCVHSLHHHHYLFLQLGAATCHLSFKRMLSEGSQRFHNHGEGASTSTFTFMNLLNY